MDAWPSRDDLAGQMAVIMGRTKSRARHPHEQMRHVASLHEAVFGRLGLPLNNATPFVWRGDVLKRLIKASLDYYDKSDYANKSGLRAAGELLGFAFVADDEINAKIAEFNPEWLDEDDRKNRRGEKSFRLFAGLVAYGRPEVSRKTAQEFQNNEWSYEAADLLTLYLSEHLDEARTFALSKLKQDAHPATTDANSVEEDASSEVEAVSIPQAVSAADKSVATQRKQPNSASIKRLDVTYRFVDRRLERVDVRRAIVPKFDGPLTLAECADFYLWDRWGEADTRERFGIETISGEGTLAIRHIPKVTFLPERRAPYVLEYSIPEAIAGEFCEYEYSIVNAKPNTFVTPRYEYVYIKILKGEVGEKTSSIRLAFVDGDPIGRSVKVYQNQSGPARRPEYDLIDFDVRDHGSYYVEFGPVDGRKYHSFSLFSGFTWRWEPRGDEKFK
ncbi:hypothetical protein [Amycolatopsis mediterranei]|uniref:hypothetical protein n=1 Tax=Amycolatopsis mediterranei TaxID=33910 RepID=UPI000B1EEA7A|nr:hypothetical protein [Amycolatopsis mediterranei]UZF69134.1 hypothetical protein ISP_002262 [Amycolatopsis mediterranei]